MYDLQHVFYERRSCETQLIMLVEDLARKASLGKQTYLILLDFSKASDKNQSFETNLETAPIWGKV